MAGKLRSGLRLAGKAVPRAGRSPRNLVELAYDRLEELIVSCELRPGACLAIGDLQPLVQVGRTPIHQAVSRFAADTLIIVRARQGLQIAPVNLARERTLLRLRRDMESFVIRLAVERAEPTHRNQILHLARALRDRWPQISLREFNQIDRRIDQVVTAAAGEPFLEHTLRPLHTIFRRIGWIYHTWLQEGSDLEGTVSGHLRILDALAAGQVREAVAATGRLIDFADSMFEVMERSIDPTLLDCNSGLLQAS